jgi:polar amino acid transport system substrate-binding protein
MYVTPERLRQVLFTDPHYQIQDSLLVAKGNPHQLNSYASIAKKPQIKLAIMAGTVEYTYARAAGIPENQIMQVPNPIAQLRAVRTGRAQAAVGTALTMKNLAKKGGKKVAIIDHFEDSAEHTGYGALAFRKSDQDLRDAVNTVLKTWLGSDEHIKTVAQFGFDETNFTKKTIEEIAR